MAADVSSLVRLLSRYDRDDGGGGGEGKNKADLVTKDLLGGCCVVGGGVAPTPGPKKVPYPDLHALTGGVKRLQTMDLNLPPLWTPASTPLVRTAALEVSAPALELKLRPLPPPPLPEYQSVCTLEKVRSALERAERESRRKQQQQQAQPPPPAGSASPASSSTTTSSAKRRFGGGGGVEEGEGDSGSPREVEPRVVRGEGSGGAASVAPEDGGAAAEMAAAGCPSCLLYVLISRSNPRCPRCSSVVPLPRPPRTVGKKARIDLNAVTAAAARSPTKTVKFF